MEFYQIRYFVAVSETRSFQLAANQLYITRQAVSKAMVQLEEELGYPLFLRTKGGLCLTPHAEFFLPRAKELVAAAERLSDDMIHCKKKRPLRIRMCYSYTTYALYENMLDDFRIQRADTLTLDITGASEHDCRKLITQGDMDIALTTLPISACTCRLFAEYPICMMMSRHNPLASKPSIDADDMRGQTFLAFNSGTSEPLYIPDCIRLGISSVKCITSDDLLYLCKRVRENRGILMSVEENMGGMLSDVVFRRYPPAGTWKHYLSLSSTSSEHPAVIELYQDLFSLLKHKLANSGC